MQFFVETIVGIYYLEILPINICFGRVNNKRKTYLFVFKNIYHNTKL